MLTKEDKVWLVETIKSTISSEVDALKLLISGQKAEIASLERRLKDHNEAFERQIIRLDDLEQYTRRTNIQVENILFSDGETNFELRSKLPSQLKA